MVPPQFRQTRGLDSTAPEIRRGGSRAGGPLAPAILFVAGVAMFLLSAAPSAAFPPAPHYSIYGDVRDEFGYLIPAGGGTVVFYFGGREVARYPLTGATGRDYTYQIRMRLDMNRNGTVAYSSAAVSAGAVYTLAVDIGGVLYYPIEVKTPPTVGDPAGRRRLDLTLGGDADLDGLPDAWEELQLYFAGLPTTDLARIAPTGDLDGDGVNNLTEYIAGTYAADATETFYLKITQATETRSDFEFFTITSKVYQLEKSVDLQSWTPAEFTVGAATVASTVYTATGVGVITGSIPRDAAEAKTFYRLKVR